VGTIRQHLEVVSTLPVARNVYVALARAALEALPSDRKKEISDLLRKVQLSN
jgi:ABC-type sulfate/molybdate transport systems ATPase subunit